MGRDAVDRRRGVRAALVALLAAVLGATGTALALTPSVVTVTAVSSGTGSGTVDYQVIANPSTSTRTGTFSCRHEA